MSAFAQGRCGGARAGTPECDTTPAKAPFEPTGWKTVYMDHFSLQAADYKREAAFYAAVRRSSLRAAAPTAGSSHQPSSRDFRMKQRRTRKKSSDRS